MAVSLASVFHQLNLRGIYLLLKLDRLFSHELLDRFNKLAVTLAQFKNVGDVELLDKGIPSLLLLLIYEQLCII